MSDLVDQVFAEVRHKQRRQWVTRYRWMLLGAALLVLAVLAGTWGWWYQQQRWVERSNRDFIQSVVVNSADAGASLSADVMADLQVLAGDALPAIRLLSVYRLVEHFLEQKEHKKALDLLLISRDAAQALGSYYQDTHSLWLAWVYVTANEPQEAVQILQSLPELSPVAGLARLLLSDAYFQAGERQKTIDTLVQVSLNPASSAQERQRADQALQALGVSPPVPKTADPSLPEASLSDSP